MRFAKDVDFEKLNTSEQDILANGIPDFPYKFKPVRRKLELMIES